MAQVLCVYSKVNVLKKGGGHGRRRKTRKPSEAVTVIPMTRSPAFKRCNDARTCRQSWRAPDLHPASLNTSATARSACWPGSISSPGKVHALVKDRHRSREFIDFLKLVDAAYPTHTRDPPDPRQSFRPHLQRDECMVAARPGRFEFTFTPKHGSWLNLVEGFFSKFARSVRATSASHPNKNSRTDHGS